MENHGTRNTETQITEIRLSGFRVDSKGWFLTYPKCGLIKEEVLVALKGKRTGLLQAIVSRELHKDGEPHLHVYLYYEKVFSCKNCRFFDIEGFHCHIESAKSLKAVQKYIKKDGDYIQEGIDYASELSAIKEHRGVLGKRFMEGQDPKIILEDHPELFFQLDKITRCLSIWNSMQVRDRPTCEGFIPNTFGVLLPLRADKKRHYWVYSTTPNKGKTTWLLDMCSKYRCSWYTVNESFQDIKKDSQFIMVDEYSVAHLKVTQLNSMCDGTYQYPVKGGTPVTCPGVIIVLAGNRPLAEVYTDPKNWPLLEARFTLINLD